MHRLVYYSANRIEGPQTEVLGQIDEILEESRRNNSLVGVTGALMFSSGFFGQVLEGPQEAIEATFERIQQDPRHGDVSLLEFAPIESRTFAQWSMAFVGDAVDALADWRSGDFDATAVGGEILLSKLRDLVSRSALAA